MRTTDPPRLWTKLLVTMLDDPDRTEILGDLTEGFAVRSHQMGGPAARRWYRRQAAGIMFTVARERMRKSTARHRPSELQTHAGELMVQRRWLDLRHAIRGFRRSPDFTLTAIATLGLGIGGGTLVFAFVHSILLTPLPYPEPDRIVGVWHAAPGLGLDQATMSRGMYFVYGEHSRTLESIALYSASPANVTLGERPERLAVISATHELFGILGATPEIGRLLLPDDDSPESPRVAILSHALWSRAFGRDEAAIGRQVHLDGRSYEVIGVTRSGFRIPGTDGDVFVPARPDPTSPWTGGFNTPGIARLADGVTLDEVNADLASLFPVVADRFQNFDVELVEQAQLRPDVHLVMDDVVDPIRATLWTLLGTVGFVLVIACGNITNLILIRAESRNREIAVRRALGADRSALTAFFFTESATLSVLGTALGLGLAWTALRFVVRWGPQNVPRLEEVGIDPVVLMVTVGLGLTTTVVFGLVPALRYARSGTDDVLRSGARGATGGRAAHRLRGFLVALQTAFALILLIGSGLLVKSFWHLKHVELGFTSDSVLTFRLSLPGSSYPGADYRMRFYRQFLERIEAIPGVLTAGMTSRLPLTTRAGLAEDPLLEPGHSEANPIVPLTGMLMASPGYFETLEVPLVTGRYGTWDDSENRSGGVLVSATLARAYWPDEDPIGKRVRHTTAGPDTWSTVIGVVDDIRSRGITENPGGDVYYALQTTEGAGVDWLSVGMGVAVKTAVLPLTIVPAVRAALRELDPNVAISDVRTIEDIVDASTAQAAFTIVVLGATSLIGLFLGAVGVYGVVAYVTGLRTREIGVRIALGADTGRVRHLIMRQGMLVATLGVAGGLAASIALTRLLQSQLYEVSPTDPVTFGAVSAVLLAVSLAATYVPARRAARIDPVEAFRTD